VALLRASFCVTGVTVFCLHGPGRYYLATKKSPPQTATVGLILCVLHHTYDRMLALQHYAGWRGKPY
jgi:hypothetical protein